MSYEPYGLEADKLRFDLFKHLTTVSTGSVLLVGAIAEGFFKSPAATELVLLACVFFVTTIFAALMSMVFKSKQIEMAGNLSEKQESIAVWALIATIVFFSLGVGSIVAFFVFNL